MSTSTTPSVVGVSWRTLLLGRLSDYAELSKPRIAALVLVVIAVSMFVASGARPEPWSLINALVGTAFVAASASAFNQLMERRTDALMDRTASRPLPAGRLTLRETMAFGAASLAIGLVYLALFVNPLTSAMGVATWLSYVCFYTPLKSRTSANTAVGAVAGALPVLIGWAAADASFSLIGGPLPGGVRVAALFLIVYLWQFPHFMAIAWIYRRQYANAGLKMLTVVEPTGHRAGVQSVLAALALAPVSVVPALFVPGGIAYSAGALILGAIYFAASVWFCWRCEERSARALLHTSLVYLPVVLLLLAISAWA